MSPIPSSPQTLMYSSLLSLKFTVCFSIIVATCIYVFVCIYIDMYLYIYTNIFPIETCSVCIKLFACVFSELTICYCIVSWCALPRGRLFFSHSQHSLIVCNILCRVEMLYLSLSALTCPLLFSVSRMFCQSC